ncbi:MAG: hypothetical protein C4332_06885 [Meiothermus sp.]
MSILLRMQNLRFAHPGQADDLIAGADWELSQSQKVGLLGLNGAGKSTLLHLVEGSLEPDSGLIERRYGSLFVLEQDDRAEGSLSAREYLLSADDSFETYQRLHQMERENLPDPLAYADLSQSFLEAGGFERLAQIERVALEFGFAPEVLERPVTSFSGGERRLLKLASAFVQNYDLYLLDEPTNYLDDNASERLVRALQANRETLLMVSHDRWFLDRVADHILELRGANCACSAATTPLLPRRKLENTPRRCAKRRGSSGRSPSSRRSSAPTKPGGPTARPTNTGPARARKIKATSVQRPPSCKAGRSRPKSGWLNRSRSSRRPNLGSRSSTRCASPKSKNGKVGRWTRKSWDSLGASASCSRI